MHFGQEISKQEFHPIAKQVNLTACLIDELPRVPGTQISDTRALKSRARSGRRICG